MESTDLHDRAVCAKMCPQLLQSAIAVLAPKWAIPILIALQTDPKALRYGELRRTLPLITDKELAKTLRHLERAGLISRTVHSTVPPTVEYALTDEAINLQPQLFGIAKWSLERPQRATQTHGAEA